MAALVLDGHLRRLARGDARGRMVLGHLGASFLRRRGQQALGFARLDDCARERLGLSGRELQSLAAVAQRTRGLPAVEAAFERGEISWAQLRLLVGVVTADTQAQWLSLASGRTVRALEALIHEASGPTDPENSDSEVQLRFRIPCPRRVKRLWHQAVELLRRTAGTSLSHAAAAEVIAAEGLSARSPSAEPWVHEPSPPVDAGSPDETTASLAPDLDWRVVDDAVPVDLSALLSDYDALDSFILAARMRKAVAALHQTAWRMGRLLRLFLDRRLFLGMGFRSAPR